MDYLPIKTRVWYCIDHLLLPDFTVLHAQHTVFQGQLIGHARIHIDGRIMKCSRLLQRIMITTVLYGTVL